MILKPVFTDMNTKSIMTLCLALAMSVSSCKEACKNKCQNGGACVDGNCICDSEYSGKYCEQLKCSINNIGRVMIDPGYKGIFRVFATDVNTNELKIDDWVINDPLYSDTIGFYSDVPMSCYKLLVIHWEHTSGQPSDTTFYYDFCVEKCKTTEIVLQRL